MTGCPVRQRVLPPMPRGIAALPVHKGWPVPWFVAWFDGVPDFRVIDAKRQHQALKGKRCLVCGRPLTPGQPFAFPLGPMCAINRTTAEAPSHVECADWSARACPFLARPNMKRRENDLPVEREEPAGVGIRRNPGVTLVWVTRTFKTFNAPGGQLIEIGTPTEVRAYREGRRATPQEIMDSITSGFPLLAQAAAEEGVDALMELHRLIGNAAVALRLNSAELHDRCLAAYQEPA